VEKKDRKNNKFKIYVTILKPLIRIEY